VMIVSVCVCVCVCLSAIISSELHVRASRNVLCMLPVMSRSSSGGVIPRHDMLRISGFVADVVSALEHSNSGKKSFDSIRFVNLINLPLVH